jgi:type 1 fimbria pilin
VTTTKTITVQFSGATASGDTTLVATDPSSGTTLDFQIWLSNSSAP